MPPTWTSQIYLKKIPCYAQFQAPAVISFLQNAFQGMAVASF